MDGIPLLVLIVFAGAGVVAASPVRARDDRAPLAALLVVTAWAAWVAWVATNWDEWLMGFAIPLGVFLAAATVARAVRVVATGKR